MGAMKPNQHYSRKANVKLKSFETGQYIAYTKFGDVLYSVLTDFNFSINSKTAFQIKLPYNVIWGTLADRSGVGDLSLSATRNLLYSEKYQVNFTIGGKIPTSKPTKKSDDGRPLPMYYQSSLGTYDLVMGVSLVSKNWLFAAGYQQPFNRIENAFTWGSWAGSPFHEKALEYPVSNHLLRGNDIMFRIERNFRSSRFNTYIGLLPIIRLTKDRIISPQTGLDTKVSGSNGLALTALYGFGYKFSAKTTFKFLFGVAIKQRHVNPDGLSREVVNTLTFEYRF
jgi:hypothetical protein